MVVSGWCVWGVDGAVGGGSSVRGLVSGVLIEVPHSSLGLSGRIHGHLEGGRVKVKLCVPRSCSDVLVPTQRSIYLQLRGRWRIRTG